MAMGVEVKNVRANKQILVLPSQLGLCVWVCVFENMFECSSGGIGSGNSSPFDMVTTNLI